MPLYRSENAGQSQAGSFSRFFCCKERLEQVRPHGIVDAHARIGNGQGTSPVVATGPISAVASHPATWGQVWQTAISSKGDLVVYDFEHGALYEFPAGGGAMITLAGPAWLALAAVGPIVAWPSIPGTICGSGKTGTPN